MKMPAQPRGKKWGNIQSRLAILLLSIFIPVLAVQGYLYYDRYQALKESEFQANLEIARAAATAFESFIGNILDQELSIGLAITSSQPMFPSDLNRLLKGSRDNPAVRDFTWMNSAGEAIYSSNDAMIGRNYSDRSYFREVADGREWKVGELIFAKTTGEETFGISRGIRDNQGALLGIVFAAIVPEKLAHLLAFERSKDAGVSLIDSKGIHVLRWPKTEYTWEQRNWLKHYPIIAEVLAGKEATRIVTSESTGKNRMVGFTPVPEIGWLVAASRAEADIVAPIYSAMLPQAIFFLLTLSLAVFIALALSRPLVTSISRLRDHALALGLGRMDNIQISGPSEIQDLSEAFNRMTQEIKLREAALRESEAKLSAIIEQLPVEVGVLNADGKFILSNTLLKQRIPQTIPSKDPERNFQWRTFHPDGSLVPPAEWPGARALRGETVLPGMEFQHIDGNGSIHWLVVSAVPFHLEGREAGAIVVIHDITTRKQTMEALRESQQRLTIAKRAAALGIHDYNVLTGVITWDPRVREMWGIAPDEAVTYEVFMSGLHPEDRACAQAAVDKAFSPSGDGQYFAEYRVISRADGTERWVAATGKTFFEDGKAVRLVGTVQDITARKKSEKELRRLNESLEQTVRERTEKLRRLASELTLVEQRERKKLSTILHDGLQQYLVAAKMQLNGLMPEVVEDRLRQSIFDIEQLLGEAVHVSRSLAAELSPPILRDAGILAGLEWLSRWMLEKHQLKVQLIMEMDAPSLSEDVKVLLFESVREMLLNTVKHSNRRSAKIHLFQSQDDQLGLTVSDDGKGFAPEPLNDVCSKTGFGLFSIQERLSVIGGTFKIDSAPGAGCRITLTAPLEPSKRLDSSRAASAEVQPLPSPASAGVSPGKVRILIVDDHIVMREGLARLLAQEPDFEVIGQAVNGQQAIERAASLQPALILMDISMPVLDGIEATKIIHQKHPHIHVIGLSLYTEGERAREMLSAGASFYMSKSGPPSELKAAIRSCCGEISPLTEPSKSRSRTSIQ